MREICEWAAARNLVVSEVGDGMKVHGDRYDIIIKSGESGFECYVWRKIAPAGKVYYRKQYKTEKGVRNYLNRYRWVLL
jgi:hypothetical protein